MKYTVFISYRRQGGEHAAKIIKDRLTELRYKVFFDVESLRSGNFNTKLYSVIDECDDFLLILSPGALDRCSNEDDWVRREVEYALEKGKNVIPIMLRNFTFDTELPPSLRVLPQLNGIEANSEFFDAFINKLTGFLSSRRRLFPFTMRFLKKAAPVLIPLLLIGIIGLGLSLSSTDSQSSFPNTRAEKNLTQEVVYCVGTNLTGLEIIADNTLGALEAIERYLYSSPTDNSILKNNLEVYINAISDVDTTIGGIDEELAKRLTDSPFSLADLKAMHSQVEAFRLSCLDNIDFLEYVASDSFYFSKEIKLEIVAAYKKYFNETLNMYACVTNMLFVDITNEAALKELHSEILPDLIHIPLNSQSWSKDLSVLQNSEKEHQNKLDAIILDLSVLTGNLPQQQLPDILYEEVSQPTNTEKTTEELLEELREKCQPLESDNMDMLWIKMTHLLSVGFYEDARECVSYLEKLDTDTYAPDYIRSLRLFIDLMEKDGLMYGCLVTGYTKQKNEILRVGDIILSVEGTPVHCFEEYKKIKEGITTDTFTLEVLRADEKGKLEKISLQAEMSMPSVYLSDIVYYQS